MVHSWDIHLQFARRRSLWPIHWLCPLSLGNLAPILLYSDDFVSEKTVQCGWGIDRIFDFQNVFQKPFYWFWLFWPEIQRSPNQIRRIFPYFKETSGQFSKKSSDLIFYLISLRIFPGSPNWVMNLTFPHLGVGFVPFTISYFVGLIPWNIITCEAGSVIASFKSKDEIIQPGTHLKLFGLGVLFLLPPLGKKLYLVYVKKREEKLKKKKQE